jgi:hypothetical protein
VLRDRPEPDDNCSLQVSVWYLKRGIDWSSLPLSTLVEAATSDDEREVISGGEIISGRRPNLEFAWRELRVVDPGEQREAISRLCLARWGTIQPLITMVYWPEHARQFAPVGRVLLTLRLGSRRRRAACELTSMLPW